MVVKAYCNKIFGGVEGVFMYMCADYWLLRVLGLLRLLEGAAATQRSCNMQLRLSRVQLLPLNYPTVVHSMLWNPSLM